MNKTPLYRHSHDIAEENNESDQWRESYRANIDCKNAITEAIRNDFDGMHLNKDCAGKVIDEYGFDRVNWVLANTVQSKDYDGRFSRANKDWANTFVIPQNSDSDRYTNFVVDSHPAVLDGFINQAKRANKSLNLSDNGISKFLYRYSVGESERNNDKKLWEESHQANIACKKAIEQAIEVQYNGDTLQDFTAKAIAELYGVDRLNWVLANTLQNHSKDDAYSSENVNWANTFFIQRNTKEDFALNKEFEIDAAPAVINTIVNQARDHYKSLGLLNSSHCVPNLEPQDYENKLLILKADILKDDCKTPQNQLFYATNGFGCSPTASGRKVFGQFLSDGEKTSFNRDDFCGVIDEKNIPDWAKEKLTELELPDETQDSGMSM